MLTAFCLSSALAVMVRTRVSGGVGDDQGVRQIGGLHLPGSPRDPRTFSCGELHHSGHEVLAWVEKEGLLGPGWIPRVVVATATGFVLGRLRGSQDAYEQDDEAGYEIPADGV